MKTIFPIFLTIWRSLNGNGKRAFYAAVVLFAAMMVIRVATPFYFSYIIAGLQAGKSETALLLGGYALIFFGLRVLEELRFTVYVYFEQIFQKSLAMKLLRRFFFIPRETTRSQAPSETAIIVDRGLGGLRNVMYNLVFSIGPLVIETLVLVIVLSLNVSVALSAIVVCLLVIFVWVTYKLTNRISKLQTIWYKTASKNFKILSESLRSQETIRSLGCPEWIHDRYARATDTFIRQVLASLSPAVIMGFLQGVLIATVVLTVSISVVRTYQSVTDAIPMLVLVNGLILQIVAPLVQFAAAYRIFIQGISSAQQLVRLLSVEKTSLKIKHSERRMDHAFQVEEAKVELSDTKEIVFTSFCIEMNSCTVIAGRTGSGKSTLARMISGLVDYSGAVYVNPDCAPIYYMSQSVDVFDASLAENICLEFEHDEHRLRQCLRLSGFSDNEIAELSNRSLGESGSEVSGGQKSRIGIARMLYHDASIIVFDEPTASLDDETAAQIRSTISELKERMTVVVVTHDNKFFSIADQVLEIDDGTINACSDLKRLGPVRTKGGKNGKIFS